VVIGIFKSLFLNKVHLFVMSRLSVDLRLATDVIRKLVRSLVLKLTIGENLHFARSRRYRRVLLAVKTSV
jgi:hypothetical protein